MNHKLIMYEFRHTDKSKAKASQGNFIPVTLLLIFPRHCSRCIYRHTVNQLVEKKDSLEKINQIKVICR